MTERWPSPLVAGQRIGHYEILSMLGRGGMGHVFLGRDLRLDRKVAIKVLPVQIARENRRWRRLEVEAKALASLSHPNIVSVFAIEEYGSLHLLVMEFVEGTTLREFIKQHGMPMPQFFEFTRSLLEAMEAAHARGVTHRDLKPENIMITNSGKLKILDFGLAKFTSDVSRSVSIETRFNQAGLTTAGVVLGTAAYMSPEQAEGRMVDHRSDLFSLGVVLYEMLTGEQPFRGRSVAQLLSSILRDEPAPVTSIRHDAAPGLAEFISRCLRKEPEDRFASAAEMLQSLDAIHTAEILRSSGAREAAASTLARSAIYGTQASVPRWLTSKWALTGVLGALWTINFVETNAENLWSVRKGAWSGYDMAAAFTWLEGRIGFDTHDAAGPLAVYLGSVAYFFVPVLLLAATLTVLLRRPTADGYRLFVVAMAVCYLVSLPFYLLLPVPERWAYPDSHAVLLSDLWSTRLIEVIRPISGIDNCFPSFHTAGTMALVLVWYRLGLRYRHTIACLGAAVVLSTILLGIHWFADILAGAGLAVFSVWAAERAG